MVRPGQTVYGELERRLGVSGAAARLLSDARDQAAARKAAGARGGPTIHPLPPGAVFEVERAALFHSSPEDEPREMPADGEHYRATVDFHQMLGSLGDYPDLLRRLGLVVDLAVPADALPAPTGFVTATPVLVAPADAVIRESVAHRHGLPQRRRPVRRRPSSPGRDRPGGPGAAVRRRASWSPRSTSTAAPSRRWPRPPPRPPRHPRPGVPPCTSPTTQVSPPCAPRASRSCSPAGPTRCRPSSAGSGTVNSAIAGGPTELFAEDLVRGYRLDVRDDAHRCLALAARAGPHGHGRAVRPPVWRLCPEKGSVQVSLAERLTPPGQAPDPNGELYVHEALVSWDGWSLSAPRAGLPLSRHPDAPDPARPETLPAAVPNDPQTAMGLGFASTVVPGSLPRLRFGRSYRLRLREVDLVGGALTLGEADALAVGDLAAEPYLRFEPVAAPAAVPYAAYREGASLHRLVIRSDVGVDPEAYAAGFNAEFPEHPGYAPVDVRHLAPPKASFDLAEKHGMFDLAMGSDGTAAECGAGGAIAAAYEVARREKGTFDDPDAPGAQVVEIPTAGRRARRPLRPARGRPARAALPARPTRHRGDLLGPAGCPAG